jgi:dihydropteroate synthase
MMGVINITPNSFSDGGEFSSKDSFIQKARDLKDQGVSIFDLGAESTAPFNDAISSEVEWQRLRPMLLSLLESSILSDDDTISIDTYKIDIFNKSYDLIREHSSTLKIIWNDVSGKLEDEVIELLKTKDFSLVVSHNNSPSRELTSSHMDYVEDEIDLSKYFLDCYETLLDHGVQHKVYFDPCFGFSKSLEQNYELLSSMNTWLDMSYRWVIGISRKSFLQKLSSGPDKIKNSELIHSALISKWMNNFSETNIIIRLHDPNVFKSAFLVK